MNHLSRQMEANVVNVCRELADAESTTVVSPLGIGTKHIVTTALLRVGVKPQTVLVACPDMVVNAWSSIIHDVAPTASIFYFGDSKIDDRKQYSFTEIKPKISQSYTLRYLAKVPPSEWRKHHTRPSFFLISYEDLRYLSGTFEQWFDYAVQDECNLSNRSLDRSEILSEISNRMVHILAGSRDAEDVRKKVILM